MRGGPNCARDKALQGSPALILTPSVSARVSVEAGSTIEWDCQVGASGEKIGMRGFGASAPIADLLKEFGFTRETLVAAARRRLDSSEKSL